MMDVLRVPCYLALRTKKLFRRSKLIKLQTPNTAWHSVRNLRSTHNRSKQVHFFKEFFLFCQKANKSQKCFLSKIEKCWRDWSRRLIAVSRKSNNNQGVEREWVGGRLFFEQHHSGKLLIAPPADSIDDCPSNCFGNGDCVSGTCHCFLGFKGPDCGRGESPCFRCASFDLLQRRK